MKILLKSVKIIDPSSKHHLKVADVFIQNGLVDRIGKNLQVNATKVIDEKSLCIAPGLVDLNCSIPDPGFEHREDINSGLAAAQAGGFTRVCVIPSGNPVVQDRAGVTYLKQKAAGNAVQLEVVAALSTNREGKDITEMFDMQGVGAIAFSDGNRGMQNAGLMSRALLYAKGINALVISFADEHSLSNNAGMHEGKMSTLLGMKGSPALAEELMIARDIFLAEYHDARIHFTQVSSAKSVDLIRAAKKKGLAVTADVAVQNLMFDESNLEDFDSNFKVTPPLRRKEDVKALWQGLKDGSIDAISTGHCPIEKEHKMVEFEIAKPGVISLQTCLSQIIANKNMPWEDCLELISNRTRKILNIEPVSVSEGSPAEFVLFDPTQKWNFDNKSNRSKSSNSALLGTAMLGKVKGIISANKYHENHG